MINPAMGSMMDLPSGTVTFLFTDIEGSTRLLQQLGDRYPQILNNHEKLLRGSFEKWKGHLIDASGDAFFVAFSKASDAALAAAEAQRALYKYDWAGGVKVRVRMGLHTGEAQSREGGYVGLDVHKAARISDAGHGGQILVSSSTEQLIREESFDGASLVYQGQHRLKDLSRPEHLFELRLFDLPSDFPPLRSLDPDRIRLPAQSTSFVGREAEVQDLLQRLRDPSCRLLSVVGPGGMGKTRSALHTAAELGDDFQDGVFFIPLESVTAPEFLVTAIVDRLNFHVDPASEDGDLESQLVQYLRTRSILLILDSFEHLTSGASFISRLLEETQALKILITSRERLNLKGEWTYELRGLSVYEKDEGGDELGGAFFLFMDRARQTEANFSLSPEIRSQVARICELVEGLPLGIELAATWVRILTPHEIVEEIEKGIDILTAPLRDLPERHQSIQAVYEYSWELLTQEEQATLRKLSVFQGGFTRRTAETVAGADIAMLAALIDKSHLKDPQDGRYAMHALSRQYARSKLAKDPSEEAQILAEYAQALAEMLQKWESAIKSGKRGEALQVFGGEIENIREAWDWMVLNGRLDLIFASLESLWLYYEMRSWFQEGFDSFSKATGALKNLKLQTNQADVDRCIAKLRTRQAWHAWRLGKYTEADVLVRRGGFVELEDDVPEQALNHHISGVIAYSQGDLKNARANLTKSLELWRKSEDPWGEAMTLFCLSLVTHARGEHGEIDDPYQRSVEVFRDVGYQFGATFSHTSLGNVVRALGDYMEAKKLCLESLELRRKLNDRWGIAACLDSLGVVESGLGELEEAMKAGLESLEIRTSLGDRRGMATSLNNLAHILFLRKDYSQARRYCEEGLQIRRELGNRKGIAASLNFLGTLALAMDDLIDAKGYVEESLSIREELGEKVGMIDSQNNLGRISLQSNQIEEAKEHFRSALDSAYEMGAIPLTLGVLVGLGESRWIEGDPETGAMLLSFAANHPSSSGDTKNQASELYRRLSAESPKAGLSEAWQRGSVMKIEEIIGLVLEN